MARAPYLAEEMMYLDRFSRLLMTLYTLASDTCPDEFPQCAMALVQVVLDFDSARLTTLDLAGGNSTVLGSILYREQMQMLLDWQEISRIDTVLDRGLAQPRHALSFHVPTLYKARSQAIMRDYANRYEHQNGLVIMMPGAVPDCWDGLCFYRADEARRFSERERRLVDLLAPHMLEALKINRMAACGSPAGPRDPTLAIARHDGQLQYAAPAFAEFICLEWPGWHGAQLPPPLIDALTIARSRCYLGRAISVHATVLDTLLLLHVNPVSPLSSLTPRELSAALLFGAGQSTKELAREMGIAPNTARNFVQQIYQKLRICGKAELAVIIEQQQAARAALRLPHLKGNPDGH